MDIKEFVERLDGSQYGAELSKEDIAIAKENGFVIVFGASDDLIEFDGVIYDEAGCFDGGDIYITKDGVSEEHPTENLIKAIWDRDDFTWQYETDIPHETFLVYENDDVYCKGIVFDINDLK